MRQTQLVNTLIPLLLALLLLLPASAIAAPGTDDERRDLKLELIGAQETFRIATNVQQRVQFKADFVFEFDKAISAACVERLSTHPKSSLESKLASLGKGTNQHPYSESELRAAIALQAQRKAEKKAK
jgi:hypothetical protein